MGNLIGIWPAKQKYANIVWQVSDVCNFKCSYCNPGNWGAKHRNLDTDRYISVLDQIIGHFQRNGYENFKFFFSGGEPTVWPPLIPIAEFLHSRARRPLLAVNTNLSRPLDWWEKHYHLFRDVVASFHVEHTRPERYLENVKFLQYRMPYLACRMLMHDERFGEVVEFAERLKRELDNYVIEYAALMETLSPHSPMHHYEEAWKREFLEKNTYFSQNKVPFSRLDQAAATWSVEIFDNGSVRSTNSNRLVSEGRNHFKGWKCWINESIFIGPNGDIRLASCSAGRIVGNIHEGEIRFPDGPVICPEQRCNCGTDLTIPKLKPGSERLVETAVSPR